MITGQLSSTAFCRRAIAFVCTVALLCSAAGASTAEGSGQYKPSAIFLTWREDPLHTMVIDWHLKPGETRPTLSYREKGRGDGWKTAESEAIQFPDSDRTIRRAALTQLKAGTAYEFSWGEDSRVYYFVTMPEKLDKPLVIAAGGDIREQSPLMEQMNKRVMAYDPAFIVWGGDLAYADVNKQSAGKWINWFDIIEHTLIARDGRVVPIVVAIGNHETRSRYYDKEPKQPGDTPDQLRNRISPFFFSLFSFPGHPGYGTLDFGSYLRLIILDTGHANPIEGEQTAWLRKQLQTGARVPYVLPVYHVPAYPSHRDYDDRYSRQVREHWTPLFDDARLRIALENHDHTFKRTVPIRAVKREQAGTIYLGDGSWGVNPREPATDRWYLDKSAKARSAVIITLSASEMKMRVISDDGGTLDELTIPPGRY